MKKIIKIVALLLVIFLFVGCGKVEDFDSNDQYLWKPVPEEVSQVAENNSCEEATEQVIINQEQMILLRLKSIELSIDSESKDLSVISDLSLEYIKVKLVGTTDDRARESLKPYKITKYGKISKIDYDDCIVNVKNVGVKLTLTFSNSKYSLSNEHFVLGYREGDQTLSAERIIDVESVCKIKVKGILERVE